METSKDAPNSRLFILCNKNITEEDLRAVFEKYGKIEDIWIVKEKSTNQAKGVVYIKYSKSSEAALAMEEMHGKTLPGHSSPIKVMIAHSREQGSRKDNDPERLQRLFIVVPKTVTQEEIKDDFKQFGDVEYVSIVHSRTTGESKGVAFVKFYRAYHAAKAFEECNRSYKPMFARPRDKFRDSDSSMERSERGRSVMGEGGGSGGGSGARWLSGSSSMFSGPSGPGGGGVGGGGGVTSAECRLIVHVPSSVREEFLDHLFRLFDVAPGLITFRPQASRSQFGMKKVLVEYSTRQNALYALNKLNGFEYPPGQTLSVNSALDDGPGLLRDFPRIKSDLNGTSRNDDSGRGLTTIPNDELATLTAALAKAENIIRNYGLQAGSGNSQVPPLMKRESDSDTFDPSYCSVRLPPPQPLASTKAAQEGPTHRLFIVCQPGLPSTYALRDIFGRFGNLVEVYTIQGKNCGYVTYATLESAEEAIKTLHFQEVCGMRIKVMVAEPPRSSDRKRLRLDDDDQ